LTNVNLTEISRSALGESLGRVSFFNDTGYNFIPSKINKNINSAFQLIGFNGRGFVREGVISIDSLSIVNLQNP
jgi:hypothetical protein